MLRLVSNTIQGYSRPHYTILPCTINTDLWLSHQSPGTPPLTLSPTRPLFPLPLPSHCRLKRKDKKFFESVTSLEKAHKKATDRLKSCQKRLTVGRNEHLLVVATTNAHLHRYISTDLPKVMQVCRLVVD